METATEDQCDPHGIPRLVWWKCPTCNNRVGTIAQETPLCSHGFKASVHRPIKAMIPE